MKTLIGISLAFASFVAQAQMSTHTYWVNGKAVTCTTSCFGNGQQCTTNCF